MTEMNPANCHFNLKKHVPNSVFIKHGDDFHSCERATVPSISLNEVFIHQVIHATEEEERVH